MMSEIAENYHRLRAELAAMARADTTIIAVAKTFPAAAVRAVAAAGAVDIGENYLQEAEEKMADCADLPLTWHFIGAIQRNKTARIARLFDVVHGVSRLLIAERLSAAREGLSPLNIFLQVNISDEKSKAGAAVEEAATIAAAVASLPNIRLRGLMAMPEVLSDADAQYAVFRRVGDLQQRIIAAGVPLDCLSMGMSGDYRQAVRAGATHIRIGSSLFGARAKPARDAADKL